MISMLIILMRGLGVNSEPIPTIPYYYTHSENTMRVGEINLLRLESGVIGQSFNDFRQGSYDDRCLIQLFTFLSAILSLTN